MAQFELKQDFDQWIEGLSARILGNTKRNSSFDLIRSYNPFYYQIDSYDRFSDKYTLIELNTEEGTEYLNYQPGYKNIVSAFYSEASVDYNKVFDKHTVNGMLVGIACNSITGNANSLIESLPKRNLGLSGRFTYSYDGRYFSEFNFGYNGSEKFDKSHRWGFFPSIGFGWLARRSILEQWAEEFNFKLKIKGTYGLIGNDEIGVERFFYLSEVNIGGGNNYVTGYDYQGRNRSGTKILNYPNSKIGWEVS